MEDPTQRFRACRKKGKQAHGEEIDGGHLFHLIKRMTFPFCCNEGFFCKILAPIISLFFVFLSFDGESATALFSRIKNFFRGIHIAAVFSLFPFLIAIFACFRCCSTNFFIFLTKGTAGKKYLMQKCS